MGAGFGSYSRNNREIQGEEKGEKRGGEKRVTSLEFIVTFFLWFFSNSVATVLDKRNRFINLGRLAR